MKKLKLVLYGLASALLVLCLVGCDKPSSGGIAGLKSESNPAAEDAATQSARAWLDLLDSGSYASSWDTAAAAFKSAVPQADWQKTAQAVRAPLGKLISRTVLSHQYTTSLPGAPDGKYVVIQFATRYEHKAAAVETVTPMLDPDGRWKVSGYYIK